MNRLEYFKDGEYQAFREPLKLQSINGGQALGIGSVAVISQIKGQYIPFNLQNVLYIPSSPVNIFSEGAALDNGLKLTVGEDQHYHYKGMVAPNGDRILTARRTRNRAHNGHFITSLYVNRVSFNMIDSDWHDTLGCASYGRVYETASCVTGMKVEKSAEKPDCVNCLEAKSTRRSFNHKLLRENVRGRVWHTDICCLPVASRAGNKFFIVFGDEASRHVRVYFLKDQSKESVWEAIEKCITDQLYDIGELPARIHADQGGAFMSDYVQSRLRAKNIKFTDATAGNHEQNGYAEKLIRDIMNVARAMLMRFNSPDILWEQAVANAVYAMNRTYKKSIDTCPFAKLFGYKPDLRHMKPFGCPVYMHVEKEHRGKRGKLAKRATLMRFVGHTESSVVYWVTDKYCNRIFTATNLHFLRRWPKPDEVFVPDVTGLIPLFDDVPSEQSGQSDDETPAPKKNAAPEAAQPPGPSDDEPKDPPKDDSSGQRANQNKSLPAEQNADDDLQGDQARANPPENPPENLPVNESNQEENPCNLVPEIYEYLIEANKVKVPSGFSQIKNNEYAPLWYASTDSRFLQYLEFETWELVPEPIGEQVLNGHWRFDLKEDEFGYVTEFKTRWVVDGSEIERSKFASVCGLADLRVCLAFAAKYGYEIDTIDANNAYLNSLLPEDEIVYMRQIRGYEDPDRPNFVCKLNKSLFGLPTSAFNWQQTLSKALIDIGLRQSRLNQCIFYSINLDRIVCVHVDDMTLMARDKTIMQKLKDEIGKAFKITDNGRIGEFLGMEFKYCPEKNDLRFKQTKKINKLIALLDKYDLPKANKLPIQPTVNLDEQSAPFVDVNLFQRAVGSMNYIATCTRPDIAIYVAQLAKCMKQPTNFQFKQLRQVASYLNATKNYGLCYRNEEGETTDDRVYQFVDAGEQNLIGEKGKRTTGIACLYNKNLVHWSSRLQTVVTSDICCAELYAINAGLRVGIGFRNLLVEMGVLLPQGDEVRVPVLCDNSSAVMIADPNREKEKGKKTTKSPRHYDLALLYVTDYIERKECQLEEVASCRNPADVLTKFVDHAQFAKLWNLLCLEAF